MASSRILKPVNMRIIAVNAENPVEIRLSTPSYGGILVMGICQNYGGVVLAVSRSASVVTVRNIVANTSWTSTALTFTTSSNGITISSDIPANTGSSRLLVIYS